MIQARIHLQLVVHVHASPMASHDGDRRVDERLNIMSAGLLVHAFLVRALVALVDEPAHAGIPRRARAREQHPVATRKSAISGLR